MKIKAVMTSGRRGKHKQEKVFSLRKKNKLSCIRELGKKKKRPKKLKAGGSN